MFHFFNLFRKKKPVKTPERRLKFHCILTTKEPIDLEEDTNLASLSSHCRQGFSCVYFKWDKLREFVNWNVLMHPEKDCGAPIYFYWIHLIAEGEGEIKLVQNACDGSGVLNVTDEIRHIKAKVSKELRDDYVSGIAAGIHCCSELQEAVSMGYKKYLNEVIIPHYVAIMKDAGIEEKGIDLFITKHDHNDIFSIIDAYYKPNMENWEFNMKKALMEYVAGFNVSIKK